MADTNALRLIKKYPNRRLYDTRTSAYITLVDVKKLVLKNETFQVIDAKTGDDLTRSILLQIIIEEEASGAPMFSCDVLSQFIRFYGNAMQGMVGTYLERNVELFNEVQKRFDEQSKTLSGVNPNMNQDLWKQFLLFQGPAMQSLVSSYMDQSRNMFSQMQEQLKSQTRNMFAGFPFPGIVPGSAPAAEKAAPQHGAAAEPGDKKPGEKS
ncbi:MAG: polyhydroxyalkanoate synthesis repressor PhaR [Betaproteobacteria bacterium]|nr:polyhydroxyalkanoate synthesis repressor PhaR [Betaproteobacteria bacterium]